MELDANANVDDFADDDNTGEDDDDGDCEQCWRHRRRWLQGATATAPTTTTNDEETVLSEDG